MLKEADSDFALQDIKDIIFNEEDNDDMMKIVAMFDDGGGASEIENALEIASDAWNYFPHKALKGLSPAEKMLQYENDDKKSKKVPTNSKKLTDKQKDLLWNGGSGGPYSQVNLKEQIRILDDSVSRIFLVVEAEINPTTLEIVKQDRHKPDFQHDIKIQQLIDRAEYRGPQFGYVAVAFEKEDVDDEVFSQAQQALEYTEKCVIKMHAYVMDKFNLR